MCYNLFVIPLGLGMRHIPEACSVMSNTPQKPWDSVKRTTQPSPVVGNDSVTAWSDPRQAHHGAGVWSSEKKRCTGTHVKCALKRHTSHSLYQCRLWLLAVEPCGQAYWLLAFTYRMKDQRGHQTLTRGFSHSLPLSPSQLSVIILYFHTAS